MNTTSFAIVGLYAGLNALIILWLSLVISKLRRKYKVSIGDGGNKDLHLTIRGHANAIENMSIVFLLLLIMAALGTPGFVLHGFGLVYTIARILHASYFVRENSPLRPRFLGAVATLLVTFLAAVGIVAHALIILFG